VISDSHLKQLLVHSGVINKSASSSHFQSNVVARPHARLRKHVSPQFIAKFDRAVEVCD